MRDFKQLANQADAKFPVTMELWTRYVLDDSRYPVHKSAWEAWIGYHFDRGVSVQDWWALVSAVQQWTEAQPALRRLVHFVPFAEIGSDFVVQLNPPYDGGYCTSRYGEFLEEGTCEPPPEFFQQIATLHLECATALRTLGTEPKDKILRRVIHATLIKPTSRVFWAGDEGWTVYSPNIGIDDLQLWAGIDAP